MSDIMADIDMRELEAFCYVVKKGSFSRAAQALYLTQPTISAHVASLERKLRVQLLVRTTKEVFLSDAGKLLYEYAEKILALRTEAVQAVESFAKEISYTQLELPPGLRVWVVGGGGVLAQNDGE